MHRQNACNAPYTHPMAVSSKKFRINTCTIFNRYRLKKMSH